MSRSSTDLTISRLLAVAGNGRRVLLALLFLGFIAGFTPAASAQTSADLKRKRNQIQKKIDYTNKLIKESRSGQRMSQTELILLNQRIALREEKIGTINHEISKLDVQIAELNSVIESMEADLEKLKLKYSRMVVYAYKNRNVNDRLLFIFTATNIGQAYSRLKYIQEYQEARKKQLIAIKIYRDLIGDEVVELEDKKTVRKGLRNQQLTDKEALSQDKVAQQQTLSSLMQKESQLRQQLRTQERQKEKLNQAIAMAIKKEIEAQKAKNSGVFKLTPEARLVSAEFENNRGRLPWPVERGLITSTFGEHPHPTISGLKIKNNGIDISTNKAASVRAVFEGEVISVIVISGAGKTVMVKHGGYYTTYSNLKEVSVKKGDKIKTKDEVGWLLTDGSNKTICHFEIWKVTSTGALVKQNPAEWIFKK